MLERGSFPVKGITDTRHPTDHTCCGAPGGLSPIEYTQMHLVYSPDNFLMVLKTRKYPRCESSTTRGAGRNRPESPPPLEPMRRCQIVAGRPSQRDSILDTTVPKCSLHLRVHLGPLPPDLRNAKIGLYWLVKQWNGGVCKDRPVLKWLSRWCSSFYFPSFCCTTFA